VINLLWTEPAATKVWLLFPPIALGRRISLCQAEPALREAIPILCLAWQVNAHLFFAFVFPYHPSVALSEFWRGTAYKVALG
jgi:hypothetical protein